MFFKNPKTTVRDATFEDVQVIKKLVKHTTLKFFSNQDLECEFRSSIYSIVVENECEKISGYANFKNSPNLGVLSNGCWIDWMHFHFGMKQVTYGNMLFLTFLVVDDPYNNDILSAILKELFLREPKIKFVCAVGPPIDSIYEEILSIHGKQIFSLNKSINRLSQSIFVFEKYNIISKMRFRRALTEDNDDLVEIVDEQFKTIRSQLGNYYMAEQVMRNDLNETIIVAEISNSTIGTIWLSTHIDIKAIADNFEIDVYGNFLKPYQLDSTTMNSRNVIDLIRKRSKDYFDKIHNQIPLFEDGPLSLNNLYNISTSSSESSDASDETEDKYPKQLFKKWQQISKNLKSSSNYTTEIKKEVELPDAIEKTNAFAIQLFGLKSSIDPRRIFDLIAASFSSYPDKDYCIISLPSAEASSDSSSGPLLRYFSRVVPRVDCKIFDNLYVAHRCSFLAEIEISQLTKQDVADVESILCHSTFQGQGIYRVTDIMQTIEQYLTNPWTDYDILTIRCGGYVIGFVVLRQNCTMCEFQTNYVLYDDDGLFPEWKSGELKYLHLHPAFMWEWVHVTREIFRITAYFSIFYKLRRESNQPVLNSILLNMFPILPRKRIDGIYFDPYALYYQNIKMCHLIRTQIENKLVIVGFNEACKGFLTTLLFKYKNIQCANITVVVECPGLIEAQYHINSFKKQHSMFFQANNQFTADYLRKLEFRTWIRFAEGELKQINGVEKRIIFENGTVFHYDRLILMSSSRYCPPKPIETMPSNYLEINCCLDKIIFYHKIQFLWKELININHPILIYGSVVMAHSCLSTLIELQVQFTQICLVIPADQKNDFPETFDDEYIKDWLYTKESEAGVKIYKNFNFVDWNLYPSEEAIESVVFESGSERITLKCLAFISFNGKMFSECLYGQVQTLDNKIVIDENSKTNIPFVYACGRMTQYQESLTTSQYQQRHFNQIEVGNQLAVNFIEERLTNFEKSILKVNFVKPIFRQFQLMDGWVYGGLRKPGRYISRQIRSNIHLAVQDLTTRNETGEYCRLCLDHNGFVCEITCLTRKFNNLEVLYRIYGLHETFFNNLKYKYDSGEIDNLLDFFHHETFSAILHDRFALLRQTIRKKNLECLKNLLDDQKKIDRFEIQKLLKKKKMDELMQKDLIEFIKKHWKSLHSHYALPNDFPK